MDDADRLSLFSLSYEISGFKVFLEVILLHLELSESVLLRLACSILFVFVMGECASRTANCVNLNLDIFLGSNSLLLFGILNMVDVINELVLSAKHLGVSHQFVAFFTVLVLHAALQEDVLVRLPLFGKAFVILGVLIRQGSTGSSTGEIFPLTTSETGRSIETFRSRNLQILTHARDCELI